MAITELIFPIYKTDQESLSELEKKAPEIFSAFQNVQGLRTLFRGKILDKDGQSAEANRGRSVLALEWDEPSSFYSFYPQSPAFQSFLTNVKPFLGGPAQPQLFEAESTSTHCLSSEVCQIIKVANGDNTGKRWAQVQKIIEESGGTTPGFFQARRLEEHENGFLAMIGWNSIADYEAASRNGAIEHHIKAMGNGGEVENLAVKFARVTL